MIKRLTSVVAVLIILLSFSLFCSCENKEKTDNPTNVTVDEFVEKLKSYDFQHTEDLEYDINYENSRLKIAFQSRNNYISYFSLYFSKADNYTLEVISDLLLELTGDEAVADITKNEITTAENNKEQRLQDFSTDKYYLMYLPEKTIDNHTYKKQFTFLVKLNQK